MDQKALQRMIAGGSRRSPVFDWLDQHYLDIVEARGDRLVISWVELAAYMEANAILDGHGKLPTPRRLAWTWQAVRRSRAGMPARSRTKRSDVRGTAARPIAEASPISPVPMPATGPVSEPLVANSPTLPRRRRGVEETHEEISEEAALEHLAEFWDSLETADGGSWRKQKNKFRDRLDALRAAKADEQTGGKKTPTP
jgi:hypothetical protein